MIARQVEPAADMGEKNGQNPPIVWSFRSAPIASPSMKGMAA